MPIVESQVQEAEQTRERYRWKDGRKRQELDIDFHLQKIIELHNSSQVVVVESETGTGKTTRIGQALLDSGASSMVYQTQIRRAAVAWNGKRIAQEMGCNPGGRVGWRLSREQPRVSNKTQFINLIDQSLVNQILREKKLPSGTIIVDEAHERSIPIDVLLCLIKEYLPNSPDTKIVITSATIDTRKFSDYFNQAPTLEIKNTTNFPVEIKPRRLRKKEHHSEAATSEAKRVITDFCDSQLTIPNAQSSNGKRTTVTEGSLLVLLPGKEDIRTTKNSIEEMLRERSLTEKVEVLECHGEVTSNERDKVVADTKPGVLRVVVATEILRSSVTVPDTVGVIDSLQVKRKSVDEKGVSHFGKVTVSGAEADQAKGRAGRQRPGFYIPISQDGEYEAITRREYSKYWPVPAIQREALTGVILQLASLNLSIRDVDLIDKPEIEKINTQITRLQKLGALDEEENITAVGRELVRYPIDPEKASVLVESKKRKVLPEAVIAIATVENEGIQFVPRVNAPTVSVSRNTAESILKTFINDRYATIHRGSLPYGTYTTQYLDQTRGADWETVDIDDILPVWIEKVGDNSYRIDMSDGKVAPNFDRRQLAATRWREFADGSNSDFVTAINAYRQYKVYEKAVIRSYYETRDTYYSRLDDWCSENGIQDRSRFESQLYAKGKKGKQGKKNQLSKKEQAYLSFTRQLVNELDFENKSRYRFIEHRMRRWCYDHSINYKKMIHIEALIQEILESIGDSHNLNDQISTVRDFDEVAVTKSMIAGFVDSVAIKQPEKSTYRSAGQDNIMLSNSSVSTNEPFLLHGGVRKAFGKEDQKLYFADMAVPIEVQWMKEVMPQLCKDEIRTENARFDEETGEYTVEQDTYFGNVVVETERIAATSEIAVPLYAERFAASATKDFNSDVLKQNLARRDRVRQLMTRNRVDWKEFTTSLQAWYERILEGSVTLTEVFEKMKYLDDQVLTELLGEEYSEFERRILSEYPDSVQIAESKYSIYYNIFSRKAEVKIPLEVCNNIHWSDFPTLGENFSLEITTGVPGSTAILKLDHASGESFDDFRGRIEATRLDVSWDRFTSKKKNEHYFCSMLYSSDLYLAHNYSPLILDLANTDEPFPEIEAAQDIWDEDTQQRVWYAYQLSNQGGSRSNWRIKVFRDQASAAECQKQADQAKLDLSKNQERSEEFEELKEKFDSEFDELGYLVSFLTSNYSAASYVTASSELPDTSSSSRIARSVEMYRQKASVLYTEYSRSSVAPDPQEYRELLNLIQKLREQLEKAQAAFYAASVTADSSGGADDPYGYDSWLLTESQRQTERPTSQKRTNIFRDLMGQTTEELVEIELHERDNQDQVRLQLSRAVLLSRGPESVAFLHLSDGDRKKVGKALGKLGGEMRNNGSSSDLLSKLELLQNSMLSAEAECGAIYDLVGQPEDWNDEIKRWSIRDWKFCKKVDGYLEQNLVEENHILDFMGSGHEESIYDLQLSVRQNFFVKCVEILRDFDDLDDEILKLSIEDAVEALV